MATNICMLYSHKQWNFVHTLYKTTLSLVVQWMLTYPNTLGPTLIHISENVHIIMWNTNEKIVEVYVHTCTGIIWKCHRVECEVWINDDSVSCFRFLYLLLAAISLILLRSNSDDAVASSSFASLMTFRLADGIEVLSRMVANSRILASLFFRLVIVDFPMSNSSDSSE